MPAKILSPRTHGRSRYRAYWVSELKYLVILIVKSRNFKCSLANTKGSFYSAVGGILSTVQIMLRKRWF